MSSSSNGHQPADGDGNRQQQHQQQQRLPQGWTYMGPSAAATSNNNNNNNNIGGAAASVAAAALSAAATEQSARNATERRVHLQAQTCLNQLFDENDHKRCSEGNGKALLAENLESLRRLVTDLEKNDWMYAAQPSNELLSMHAHESNYFADNPPA